MIKKARTWVFQRVGNYIYNGLKNCDEKHIKFWLDTGLKFDSYCIAFHDIYLE